MTEIERVRRRLASLALSRASRAVSAVDITGIERIRLGNAAGSIFKTPYFAKIGEESNTAPTAHRRKVNVYQYVGE